MISNKITTAAKLYYIIYPTSKNHFYTLTSQQQRDWIDKYCAVEKLFARGILK